MIDYKKIPDSKRFSVVHDMSRCINCGKPAKFKHEIFFGYDCREASKAFGMVVGLDECHEGLHRGYTPLECKLGRKKKATEKKIEPSDESLDSKLKKLGQEVFEYNHTREDFIKYFHRSYL